MKNHHAGRRKSDNSIPRWGWIVILSFIALIAGTVIYIKGIVPAMLASLNQKPQAPSNTKLLPPALPTMVLEDSSKYNSAIIRANSLAIITRAKFLTNCAQSGFIFPHAIDYYLGCVTAVGEIKDSIKRLPMDDLKTSEARSHLVEMAVGFERMVQCFEESESESDGKKHFWLSSENKLEFAMSAKSVIEHYERLDLVCPQW